MVLGFSDYEEAAEFDTDILIIGTGAGGAAAGTELAETGHRVLFVEEGGYHPTSSFNPYLTESVPRLYRDASATVIFGTPPIPFIEGRCVGGSTVINGGMTYRPPERVLETWGRDIHEDLGPRAMEPLFEKVERRISAAAQSDESVGNDSKLMVRGAKAMGWSYTVNRRNQVACVGANSCTLGCPTGAKQSALVSYLPSAFALGAECLTEIRIDRLIVRHGRCAGAVGYAIDPVTRTKRKKVTIRARAVIVACGAIQTPYLLLRHGLGRPSRQLGKNFACHPNAKVLAIYPFDIEGWKGVSQYAQIREFHHEGILFAENFVPAGAIAAHLPVDGPEAWDLMRRYNQMVLSGVLVEDSTTGKVGRSIFGMPTARYDITRYDYARFIKGVGLLAKMHFALGAELVLLPFANVPPARGVDDVDRILATGHPMSDLELFTVHLMGTARMGADARSSVVDLSGEMWDLPGCYVSDASVFPSAIGVNPQVTIMAFATRIAHRLAATRLAA